MARDRYTLTLFILMFIQTPLIGQEFYRNVYGGKLYGKLESPKKNNTNVLIFFIQGSGPTDLNGNSPFLKSNHFKLLSDSLLKQGHSTFRFDKRGIAKSTFRKINESQITIDLLVNDVVEWIKYLKMKLLSPKIYFLGHSEGSLIAALAFKKVKIEGIISISGAGRKSNEILKDQLSKLDNNLFPTALGIIDSLSKNHRVKNIPNSLQVLFRPTVQPYLLSWFKYTPSQIYQTFNPKSVLIVHGDSDFQVNIKESFILSGNKIKTVIIPKMNHLLKIVENNDENIDSYMNENYKVSSGLVFEICKFINGLNN